MAKQIVVEAGFYGGKFLTPGEFFDEENGRPEEDLRRSDPFIPSDSSLPAETVAAYQIDIAAIIEAVPPLVQATPPAPTPIVPVGDSAAPQAAPAERGRRN